MKFIHEQLDEQLVYFGYSKDNNEENKTGFFDIQSDKHMDKMYGFKNLNKDMKQLSIHLT